MGHTLEEIKTFFSETFDKRIHSSYVKEGIVFGDVYFINDAYVIKDYDDINLPSFSLERLSIIHQMLAPFKSMEKVLLIDEENKIKVTKIVHGDVSYIDEPTSSQLLNVSKLLKKLHKNKSEYDIPMDLESLIKEYKNSSNSKISKVLENRIIREFNQIKDKTPVGLCHNLLNKDNIVYRIDSTLLINFECANTNYIYFDLASYIVENKLKEKAKIEFLNDYFGASYNSLRARRVDTFINIYCLYYYYYYQAIAKSTNEEKYIGFADKIIENLIIV